MKKTVFYFDPTVQKILAEKVDENGEKKLGLSSPYNFVSAAEIVARIIDIDSEDQIPTRLDTGYKYYKVANFIPLKADSGIYYDEQIGAYKASEYGFIILAEKNLRLIPPITISKDKLKAYYSIYPTKLGKVPLYSDIEETLHSYNIIGRLDQKKIEKQLDTIDLKIPKFTRILVGRGQESVEGHDEYYMPLIDIDKKAGEMLADGSIDFKETGAIIEIAKDQEVLQRYPAEKPVDGYNVYGDKIPAELAMHQGYSKGDNIVLSDESKNICISSIDGCLNVERKKISVLPVVVINGDVNYETGGNIDFNGSVHINGSVLPGFTVKASGDITIENSVEDSHIEAEGDVNIKMGVVGKESVKIVSNGNVRAKFLLNAKVEAAGEIIVEDSIINCDVFSNNKITVVAKNGKIIGGKTTALYEIMVNVSGSINETETSLNVGRNLFIEKELLGVHKEISKWRETVEETMRKLKVSFGEAVFENPKEYIKILPAVKKKNCLLLLKELSSSNKELKKYIEKSKEIQGKLKLEREPYIIVKDKAYPGTVINIKKSVKKLDSTIDNVKYYEDPEEKIIRFTPAV